MQFQRSVLLITAGCLLMVQFCNGAAVLPEETETEAEIEIDPIPNESESETRIVPLKGLFTAKGNKGKGKGKGDKNQSNAASGSQNIECMKDLDKLKMLEMIREMTGMVEEGLAAGGTLITNEATRASYLGVTQRVMESWKGGWAKKDMIDAVSTSISDPLKEIPTGGPMIAFAVKASIRTYLTRRKAAAGC